MSVKLPVYEVAHKSPEPEGLTMLATELFGAKHAELEELDGRVVARQNGIAVELHTASGGIFAADQSRLRDPHARPSLPSAEKAYALAGELLERHNLLPDLGSDDFELTNIGAGGSLVAVRSNGRRSHHALDVQARYAVTLRNPGVEGEPERLPMIGGGGKVSVTFGGGAKPIGLMNGWRTVTGKRMVEAIDVREATERFTEFTKHLELTDVRSYLAYHAAPAHTSQELLTPVYVFGATIVADDGERVPMRLVSIPATEFGPEIPHYKPQPARKPQKRESRSTSVPRGPAANPSEAGTSWIGMLGGLGGSQQNAQGFVDSLAADGWTVNFNWGDANAWESDWDANDDNYLDTADFVFYTGHANQNGWMLANPGTQNLVQLTPSVVGSVPQTPGDRWGQQDLEWVIVAACGPLQDDIISAGGGDVLSRWEGAFDGLHTLMGYGAVTNDNTEEGRRVVQYSREGTPVIDAWFRTAQEIQPSTNGYSAPNGPDVWVGAMYVAKPGADPRQDRIWGHGTVAPDPSSPTDLVCMWTTC